MVDFHHSNVGSTVLFKSIDVRNGVINQCLYSVQRQLERVDGAFKTFQQVYAHESLDASFTASLGQVFPFVVSKILILLQFTRKDIVRRCIDAEGHLR